MQGSILDNGMNIVAHNLLAMNAQRQYGLNATSKAKSAESVIRDTNMAKEMVSYSMANILEQVGQSMLCEG